MLAIYAGSCSSNLPLTPRSYTNISSALNPLSSATQSISVTPHSLSSSAIQYRVQSLYSAHRMHLNTRRCSLLTTVLGGSVSRADCGVP